MYRTDNEFVREFNRVRKQCRDNEYPISPEFAENAEYAPSSHPFSIRSATAISNGAVNFYNFCLTLCTASGAGYQPTPALFRLRRKSAGLVRENVIIDQTKAVARSSDFVYAASMFYSAHRSADLIEKFDELLKAAPSPQPQTPDPLAEKLLLKYLPMMK